MSNHYMLKLKAIEWIGRIKIMLSKKKNSMRCFCTLLGIVLVCSLFCGKVVFANTTKEIAKVDNSDFLGNINNTTVTLSRNGNLLLSFQEKSYGYFTIDVTDSNGNTVFSTEYDFCFDSKTFTISNLKAGTYSVLLTRESDICDCYLDIYGIFVPDDTYPEFSLSNNTLTIEKKKSASIQIKVTPLSVPYTVEWKSDNSKIASVSNTGSVKANLVGTTKIRAHIYLNGKLYQTLVCTIHVKSNWKYKDFSSSMKKYAKKHKNLTYKDIDKGRVCRLYATGYLLQSFKHLYTQGIASHIIYLFYIELKKNGDNLSLKLYFENEFTQLTLYDEVDLDAEQFKLKSSNRKLNFDLSILKDKSYYSRKGYYYGSTKSRAVISDASKTNISILNKFRTMLGQSSTTYKVVCGGGASISSKLTKRVRKTTRQLIDEYKTLLKYY